LKKIKEMDQLLINKIAAGEIIEHPLSIVKELVENAIDAGSDEIKVELRESGLEQIIITDNGHGMDEYNLSLSIKRHATSKLYSDDNLFKIGTLGFRGEALASIVAVSFITIKTSPDGKKGYELRKIDEEEFQINEIPFNKGTQIKVENLFYNTPVKYKHLSSIHYELAVIVNFINKIALAKPHIKFTLINDDKTLINIPGNDNVIDNMMEIYGIEVARTMISKKNTSDNFEIDINFSHPDHTRSRKNFMTIIINDRIVKNYKIEKTIIESYKNFLHTNQYPIVRLVVKCDYSIVDVNIHPTKQEVKISLMDELLELITKTITSGLFEISYIPTPELEVSLDSDQTKINIEKMQEEEPVIFEQRELDFSKTITQEEKEWKLPFLEYIGTYHNTFLLFETGDGLYLLDQHAAQERVNYEKIKKTFTNKKFNYQQLSIPLTFTLSQDEFISFEKNMKMIESLGVNVEVFGINTIKVTEIDTFYYRAKNLEQDIWNLIKIVIKGKKISFDQLYDDVAILMACKSSIKANQYLNHVEIKQLLNDLNDCENIYTCPHGRPIMIEFTLKKIEKMFKRIF